MYKYSAGIIVGTCAAGHGHDGDDEDKEDKIKKAFHLSVIVKELVNYMLTRATCEDSYLK